MKRKGEECLLSNKLVKESHHQCYCLLDLNYSSNLLSTKIADIPHKLKYETILAPIFEYCFGTSDQDKVWEHFTNAEITCFNNGDYFTEPNNSSSIINLKIDWKRDETFIYSQIFNLVKDKLDILATKFGLWNNRQFILNSFYFNQISYPKRKLFNNDRELVMISVTEYPHNLRYASHELKNDKEIVRTAIKRNGHAFRHVSQYYTDDKEMLLLAMEDFSFLESVSDRLKSDRDVVIKAVSVAGNALFHASQELKKDKEIVMKAIQNHPNAFKHASDELKGDREFVKEMVKINGECLQFASKEFREDKEIVELALKSNPDAIHYISGFVDSLRNNSEFISNLIGNRGFKTLPNEFSHDGGIILESIKVRSFNLRLAATELQNDREFILQVLSNCGIALEFVTDELKSDREIIMTAVTQNGNALQYAPDEFYGDKEILLKSAETATPCFGENFYAKLSEPLQNDRELLMKCSMFFQYFPRRYQLDREMIMQALKSAPAEVLHNIYPLIARERVLAMRIVKQDGLLLGELPSKYRNDREIVSFAIQQNKKAFKFVPDELKNDLEILKFNV